jgi:2-iminobutanoate/2-iminopropanoate deaminase
MKTMLSFADPRRIFAGRGMMLLVLVLIGSGVAGCAGTSTWRYINLPERSVQAPFSDGLLAGNTLYLAGRLGLDPQTGRPPEDPSVEARLLLEQFQAVLGEAGMTMADLVFVQIFSPDLTLFDTWNQVYRTFFDGPFPPRGFIGSGPLLFGARFEMQAIAVKR